MGREEKGGILAPKWNLSISLPPLEQDSVGWGGGGG